MDELLIQIRDLDRAITAHQESIRYEIIKCREPQPYQPTKPIRELIDRLSREYRERSQLLERYLTEAEQVKDDNHQAIHGRVRTRP